MREEHSYGIIPFKHVDTEWKVFLVKLRSGNHWGFPKGHAEGDEEPLEVACRELKEETGLAVTEFFRVAPFTEKYTLQRAGQDVHKTVVYYPAIVEGTPQIQVHEILEGKWVPFDEAIQTLTYREGRALFQKVHHDLQPYFQKKT